MTQAIGPFDQLSGALTGPTLPSTVVAQSRSSRFWPPFLPAAHLSPQEAALYIGTKPEVLRSWRCTGRGPRFKGRGHFVRYAKSNLDEFMSAYDHRFVDEGAHAGSEWNHIAPSPRCRQWARRRQRHERKS